MEKLFHCYLFKYSWAQTPETGIKDTFPKYKTLMFYSLYGSRAESTALFLGMDKGRIHRSSLQMGPVLDPGRQMGQWHIHLNLIPGVTIATHFQKMFLGTALPYITQSRGCGFCYARYVYLDDDLHESRQDFWTCSRWILLSKWFSQFLTVKDSQRHRHGTWPNKFLMCQNLICFYSACHFCGKRRCIIRHDYVLNCRVGDFLWPWRVLRFGPLQCILGVKLITCNYVQKCVFLRKSRHSEFIS